MPTRTIYALSTPFLTSAIAIIRVSGTDAKVSLQHLCRKTDFDHGKACVVDIFDSNDEILDNAMILFFQQGKSYTGEDLVEYHVHGSLAVIKDVLYELGKIPNFRMAKPGEFTKRALENGKLNLNQVEGIVDLIAAQTSQQRKQSLRQLKGEIRESYKQWYDDIKLILALIEATLDFSDQELDVTLFAELQEKLKKIHANMKLELSHSGGMQKLKNGISVAILGSPNVGKSSLLNCLAAQDLSIVSDIAGTTRDIVETFLDIQGFPVSIADTAGIRNTTDKIELEGVTRALNKSLNVDIKIIMFDASKLSSSYLAMEKMIDENSILVINKIDLNPNLQLPNEKKYHLISIKNQQGIGEFQKTLVKKLEMITLISENPIIIQQRHIAIIHNVAEDIQLAIKNFHDPIIVAYYLRNSLKTFGEIFGEVDIEEILGIIFTNMCIGK